MSRQRATNEALKAWMASRPESEQQGVALKARLRALATREGDVPCAVETQRQLGSRLRNHL